MTTLSELITELNGIVNNSCIYSRWGGMAFNRTDKDLPYGIGTQGDCKGNIYSYDDKEACSGYMYIKEVYTKLLGRIPLEYLKIGFYIFVSTKVYTEYEIGTYQRANILLQALRRKYGLNNVIVSTPSFPKYGFQEIALIELDVQLPFDCDLTSLCN